MALLASQLASLQQQLVSANAANATLTSRLSQLGEAGDGGGRGDEGEEGEGAGEVGWRGYVEGLRGKELALENRKLQAQVDFLNDQRAKSDEVIAAYERGGGGRLAKRGGVRVGEEGDRLRLQVRGLEGDNAALKGRVESLEVEVFTAQEAALQRDEAHRSEVASLTAEVERLQAELTAKAKMMEAHSGEVAALRAHFEDREARAQSDWMQRHGVRELGERVERERRERKQAEEALESTKRRLEEARADLTLVQGRYEEEVLHLRKDLLDADATRRARDEATESVQAQLSSMTLEHRRVVAEVALVSKQLSHAQTEVGYYRDRLREVEAKGRGEGEDEAQLRLQLKLKGEEAEAAKAELSRTKVAHTKAIDDAHSLSLLTTQLTSDVREREERLHQLQLQLDLLSAAEGRHKQATRRGGGVQQRGGRARDPTPARAGGAHQAGDGGAVRQAARGAPGEAGHVRHAQAVRRAAGQGAAGAGVAAGREGGVAPQPPARTGPARAGGGGGEGGRGGAGEVRGAAGGGEGGAGRGSSTRARSRSTAWSCCRWRWSRRSGRWVACARSGSGRSGRWTWC